eukprot:4687482-Prymnesium_polylepis.1
MSLPGLERPRASILLVADAPPQCDEPWLQRACTRDSDAWRWELGASRAASPRDERVAGREHIARS